MKKGFVILVGNPNAKNLLQERLKNDYWTWNVSPLNQLRHNASQLGWTFDNTELSDEFIEKLLALSNEYLEYEYNYVVKFIDKINQSTKAEENGKQGDLLIAHVNKELADRLQDEFSFYVLHVDMSSNNCDDNFRDGRFVLGLGDGEEVIDESLNKILDIICK